MRKSQLFGFIIVVLFPLLFVIEIANASVFGIRSDTLMYKADDAGNTIWVLNFSGKIDSLSPYSNTLKSCVLSGSYVYAIEVQGPPQGTIGDFIPAIIILDTLGNILSETYNIVSPPGFGYFLTKLIPSVQGGVWFGDEYRSGITLHPNLYRIDSNAFFKSALNLWINSESQLQDYTVMPDSNYVALIFDNSGGFGTTAAVAKFNDSGHIFWIKNIFGLYSSTFSEFVYVKKVVADSSGNFYVFADYTNHVTSQFGCAIVKMNSNGAIVSKKLFPDLSTGYMSKLSYSSGQISVVYDTTQINIDTLLLTSCLQSDTISLFSSYQAGASSNPASVTYPYTSNFIPVLSANFSFSPLPSLYPDYCTTARINDELFDMIIDVYPNPATSEVWIHSTEMKNKNYLISLYNFEGQKVQTLEQTATTPILKIDLKNLAPGIYYLNISDNSSRYSRKLVIVN